MNEVTNQYYLSRRFPLRFSSIKFSNPRKEASVVSLLNDKFKPSKCVDKLEGICEMKFLDKSNTIKRGVHSAIRSAYLLVSFLDFQLAT